MTTKTATTKPDPFTIDDITFRTVQPFTDHKWILEDGLKSDIALGKCTEADKQTATSEHESLLDETYLIAQLSVFIRKR
jgi:hypothetical protein